VVNFNEAFPLILYCYSYCWLWVIRLHGENPRNTSEETKRYGCDNAGGQLCEGRGGLGEERTLRDLEYEWRGLRRQWLGEGEHFLWPHIVLIMRDGMLGWPVGFETFTGLQQCFLSEGGGPESAGYGERAARGRSWLAVPSRVTRESKSSPGVSKTSIRTYGQHSPF
jgi:hypothetical protein